MTHGVATGWPTMPLGALITDIQPGFASGKHNSTGEGIPHFRPMNVSTDGRIERKVLKYVEPAAGRPDLRLRRGDVVFNNTNSPELVGKTALFEDDDAPAFSNHMTRLRSNMEHLDPAYLAIRLHQAWREGWFASHCNNHVSQSSIGRDVLRGFEIELPPVTIQRAIAALYHEVDVSRSSASGHLALAGKAIDNFRRAVLAAACSGRLTADWRDAAPIAATGAAQLKDKIDVARQAALGRRYRPVSVATAEGLWDIPDQWVWSAPEQLLRPDRSLTYGVIKLGISVPDGVPTLRSSDVRWLRIDDRSVKRISRRIADKYRRTYLEGGEVLVTVRGTLGGVAVAPERMAGWNVSREVAVIPTVAAVHAPYISFAIGSSHCQRWMATVARGVAYTGVNIEDLKRLPLPLPSFREQVEISKRVEQLMTAAEGLVRRIDGAKRRVDSSSQAVLSKAFRGELLPAGVEETTAREHV